MKEEGKEVAMEVEGIVKEATPKTEKQIKQEQQEAAKRAALLQKHVAQELADYKRRLRESVEMKRLQVEELKLNLEYFHYRKELQSVEKEMSEMEAKEKAQLKAEEESKKVIPIKRGKPKNDAEIAEAKSVMEEIHGK